MRRVALSIALATFPLFASAQTQLAEWSGADGDHLGLRVIAAGDVDRDAVPDFAIGSVEAVRIVSGRTHAVLRTFSAPQPGIDFARAIASGDCNGDGWPDLIVGAPRTSTLGSLSGTVWVYSGRTGQVQLVLHGTLPLESFGSAIALLGDVTLDGKADFAVGSPAWSSNRGRVRVISGADGTVVLTVDGTQANARFGQLLASVGDVDGDQRQELGIGLGSSYWGFEGVQVWSLASNELLYEMTGFYGSSFACVGDVNQDGVPDVAVGGSITLSNQPIFSIRFGGGGNQSVSAPEILNGASYGILITGPADYDGDGVAEEFVVGHPDPGWGEPGRVHVYRGVTLLRTIYDASNSLQDAFGYSVAGVGDVDGNGSAELVVGAPYDGSQPSGVASGRVVLLSTVTPEPVGYCTAKTNGLGCVPQLAHAGAPSLTGQSVLTLTATQLLNRRTGLCLWGAQRQELPFQGGYLCVAPPIHRGAATSTGGSASGDDCSGALEFSFLPTVMWLHAVEIGDLLRAQFWYRDPLHPDGTGTGLSAALEFRVGW